MGLIARCTQTSKQSMSREQLVNLLSSSANLMDERNDIIDYIASLEVGKVLDETEIKTGYQQFKAPKNTHEQRAIAQKHGLADDALIDFVRNILDRMIFDGEQLTDLLAPLELGWKAR